MSVFIPDEAVAFLEKRTGIIDASGSALRISRRLGCFPLALEQAAAYIKINRFDYEDYLKLLDEYGLELLEEIEGVIDYNRPVRATRLCGRMWGMIWIGQGSQQLR